MALNASFHKNVDLLSQLVPPNEAFRRHFRKGMFEKPNTAGFIHVSHYLLTIYDTERFKKFVEWPIVCKKSESKYRNDVKDFIAIIASEHPQVGFPQNLAASLLHTGGYKFISVMWKLSQVTLYVYLSREETEDLLAPPQSGIANEVTKSLLNNAIASTHQSIIDMSNKFSEKEKIARTVVETDVEEINKLQNSTLEIKREIADLVSKTVAAPIVKPRLMNIHDNEIIQIWRESQAEQIQKLKEQTDILKTIEDLSTEVAELTASLLSDSKILDVAMLPKLNTDNDLHSMVPPESQVLFSHIYADGKLVLNNLLKIVDAILNQLKLQLQINGLQDFTQCQLQVQASNEDAISMCNIFLTLLERTTNIATEVRNTMKNKNVQYIPDCAKVLFRIVDDVLFMPSPVICIDTENDSTKANIQNRLALTPVEGTHKALFSRHKRHEETTPQSSKLRTNLLVSRINFNDTLSSTASEKVTPKSQPFKMVSRMNSSIQKKSEKYARLFSGHHKINANRANSSILSIPSTPKANSTALMNTISETNSGAEIGLDFTAKNIFNLSKEILGAVSAMRNPNNRSPLKQSKPQLAESVEEENCVENGSGNGAENSTSPLSSLNKVIKPLLDDDKEIEVTTESLSVPENSKRRKRRSISDLVERYKIVLEQSQISSHLETSE